MAGVLCETSARTGTVHVFHNKPKWNEILRKRDVTKKLYLETFRDWRRKKVISPDCTHLGGCENWASSWYHAKKQRTPHGHPLLTHDSTESRNWHKCETNRSMRDSEGKVELKACAAMLLPSNRNISCLSRVQTRHRKFTATAVHRPNVPTSPGVCDGCQRVPPADGNVFGSSTGGPLQTTVVEGLVIPGRLDTVQATNFVLTQQVY